MSDLLCVMYQDSPPTYMNIIDLQRPQAHEVIDQTGPQVGTEHHKVDANSLHLEEHGDRVGVLCAEAQGSVEGIVRRLVGRKIEDVPRDIELDGRHVRGIAEVGERADSAEVVRPRYGSRTGRAVGVEDVPGTCEEHLVHHVGQVDGGQWVVVDDRDPGLHLDPPQGRHPLVGEIPVQEQQPDGGDQMGGAVLVEGDVLDETWLSERASGAVARVAVDVVGGLAVEVLDELKGAGIAPKSTVVVAVYADEFVSEVVEFLQQQQQQNSCYHHQQQQQQQQNVTIINNNNIIPVTINNNNKMLPSTTTKCYHQQQQNVTINNNNNNKIPVTIIIGMTDSL